MEIEFSGHYEKSDYFRAVRWFFRPTKREWIIRVGAFILFLGIYIALLFTTFSQEDVSTRDMSRIVRHLFTVFLLLFVLVQPYITAYRTASQLWADPVTRRKVSGYVSGIGVQIAPSQNWIAWDDFIKVHQSSDLIVLLTAARSFVALPRAFFRDDREWKMVQDMVNGRVQQIIT